jgi:hypothetical protein
MKAKILERITERTINELAPVIAERLQARTEIKGEIALNHDEFCALYAAIEQLLYYKDDKPNPSSGYVQMACSLSQEEIKSLVNIFERLKQM